MSCNKCDGSGIFYEDGTYKRCNCISEDKFSEYLSDLGTKKDPPFEIHPDEHKEDLYVDVRGSDILDKEMNGIISLFLIQVYPLSYRYYSIGELYSGVQGDHYYADLDVTDSDILVITGGLSERQEKDKENNEWTEQAYTSLFEQIAGDRIRAGKYTWFFDVHEHYSSIQSNAKSQGFNIMTLSG